jgi:hypothetical protein
LAVRAAAKVVAPLLAARTSSAPELNAKSAPKSTETTKNDGLLDFMVQPLELQARQALEKQFVIKVLRLQFRCLL